MAKALSDVSIDLPVFILNDLDKPSTELYLRKNGVPFQKITSLDDVPSETIWNSAFYIVTSEQNKTVNDLATKSNVSFEIVNDSRSFTSIIRVQPKNN